MPSRGSSTCAVSFVFFSTKNTVCLFFSCAHILSYVILSWQTRGFKCHGSFLCLPMIATEDIILFFLFWLISICFFLLSLNDWIFPSFEPNCIRISYWTSSGWKQTTPGTSWAFCIWLLPSVTCWILVLLW